MKQGDRKRERQEQAAARQEARDKRSTADQLEKLVARGVKGGKEYRRLMDEIAQKRGHEHPGDSCQYLGAGLWSCGVTDQH